MKKQLLCTSAIALGVAAAPATAQDWNLDWGGYMNTHVAVGDISTDAADLAVPGISWDGEGLDIHQQGEIIFTPSVTLDNGMTFGINVQMEAMNAGGGIDGIDEKYISISSDTFGQLDIGSENSAGYKMMTGAPGVTSMFINSPSTSAFIPYTGVDSATGSFTALPFRQAGLSNFIEVGGNNDVNRITYYTPDFSGLTVGLSYAPTGVANATSGSFSVNTNAVLSDIFDIGINYSGSFGSTDILLAARWGTGDSPSTAVGSSDFEAWGVGASATFGSITIGGGYTENDNDETIAGGGVGTAIGDSEGWSFGVVYDAAGPWAFEALTYQSETNLVLNGVATAFDVEREAYRIGASRTLGPGVDWDIYVVYENRDDTGVTPLLDDVEGTVLGTAINLSF